MGDRNLYNAPRLTHGQLVAMKLRLTNLLSGQRVNGDLIHHALLAANAENATRTKGA